jgi:hypothetical protein
MTHHILHTLCCPDDGHFPLRPAANNLAIHYPSGLHPPLVARQSFFILRKAGA